MATLLLAEHNNHNLHPATLSTATAALKLGQALDIVILGSNAASVVTEAASIESVRRVIHIDSNLFQHKLAESVADAIVELASDYQTIMAPATTFGKNCLPRVAAILDVAQISDVVDIIDATTFIRPIFAGNALETVKSLDAKQVLTIRTTAFAKAACGSIAAPCEVRAYAGIAGASTWVSEEMTQLARPELTSARVVVSGGRALQSAENFKLIEQLADALGGAVGASRAAVDAGYVPNDFQVGQTGKVVAPDLYIAIGISGAVQHLAGMKDSKVIVAINKDIDAPIFQIATYSLVGDLFQIVPELIQACKQP